MRRGVATINIDLEKLILEEIRLVAALLIGSPEVNGVEYCSHTRDLFRDRSTQSVVAVVVDYQPKGGCPKVSSVETLQGARRLVSDLFYARNCWDDYG